MSNVAAVGTEFRWTDRRWVVWGGSLTYGLLLVRTAWVSDDAYITFRTVFNFLHGYGLRWNIVNRVQAFTHPLWMFVMTLAAAITGDVYFTSIFVSIALTLGAIALVTTRLASSLPMVLVVFSALAASKSFVEYSTSGLENALTHLLLAGFFLTCFSARPRRHRMLTLSALAALLMLNRIDTGLLILPPLALELWRARGERPWLPLVAGMLPLVAWEVFSLIYYGFPLPNTAYAKLGPGVPRIELLQQGVLYLLDSLGNDPFTPMVILAAVLSPFVFAGSWPAAFGIVLYIAYTVWVGGDFMSGRFLAAPFFCAVVLFARQPLAPRFTPGWVVALGLMWLVAVSGTRPTIFSNAAFGDIAPEEAIPGSHITDERRFYYSRSGLLAAQPGVKLPDHRWFHLGEEDRDRGAHVAVVGPAGFFGYAAGPSVHVIDRYGLGDPLLARLPAEVPWQIGHFERRLPPGYEDSLIRGVNAIRDPAVAAYYEALRTITEGPIWTRRRFRMILRMNLGRYEPLIAAYGTVQRSIEEVSVPREDGTPWNAQGNLVLTLRGASIAVGRVCERGEVELSVSANDSYRVQFMHDGKFVGERTIHQPLTLDGGLHTYRLTAPLTQWDSIDILPSGGDGRYSLGHLRYLP